jgi:hypothetical protein
MAAPDAKRVLHRKTPSLLGKLRLIFSHHHWLLRQPIAVPRLLVLIVLSVCAATATTDAHIHKPTFDEGLTMTIAFQPLEPRLVIENG